MKITFAKRWVSVVAKYVCKCGHRFTRNNRDWYTINPFNTGTPSEIYKTMSDKLRKRERPCPKCKKVVKPNLDTTK